MTEDQLDHAIRDLAGYTGWLVYHTHDSRHSPAGFPDLVLVRPPRLIFAELKSTSGTLSAEQKTWLDQLAECNVEVHVWRPEDWDRIVSCLNERGPRMVSV